MNDRSTIRAAHAALLANNGAIYEQGKLYLAALLSGLWDTQASLAQEFAESKSHISRKIALAAIPPAVIEAFGDPHVVSFRLGDTLLSAIKELGEDRVVLNAYRARELRLRSPENVLQVILTGRLAAAQQTVIRLTFAQDERSMRIESPQIARLRPYHEQLKSYLERALLDFERTMRFADVLRARDAAVRRQNSPSTPKRQVKYARLPDVEAKTKGPAGKPGT
ncbi:hypothetical protein [Paraburkholderia unamae]|uniref:SopB HTH domain-containing protein n=1 Tax=Paraburkholderia unamae TaxID=219649 RepID=A0ABX5KWH1_9BURK|nr:hypothetical protein [Paraburkholderia unamae]PVX85840.1 hypothetical protein C7402_103418 [Paraburkholderia unamae]